MKSSFDELSAIIAYEQGELDDDGVIELFQHLVDNGHAWSLQGSYGRMAMALIKSGQVKPKDPMRNDEVAYAKKRGQGVRASWSGD